MRPRNDPVSLIGQPAAWYFAAARAASLLTLELFRTVSAIFGAAAGDGATEGTCSGAGVGIVGSGDGLSTGLAETAELCTWVCCKVGLPFGASVAQSRAPMPRSTPATATAAPASARTGDTGPPVT